MTSATRADAATGGRAIAVAVPPKSAWEARIIVVTVLVLGLVLSAVVLLALRSKLPRTVVISPPSTSPKVLFPVGVPNPGEPSGMAPPTASALPSYQLSYLTDFLGGTLPAGWVVFTGKPGGVPNGQFASTHVSVGNGLLRLGTWRDPNYGNVWTTGGLCQCGRPLTYGAIFVRSRITGPGPNEVELLWPLTNRWPPEVDVNETGARSDSTSWTVHYGRDNNFVNQPLANFDMTKWHTFGVIWTPTSLTFTVDGRQWGQTFTVSGAIPQQAMTLDFEQRPACLGPNNCVAADQSMLIDWVAEYQAVSKA